MQKNIYEDYNVTNFIKSMEIYENNVLKKDPKFV